MDESEASWPVLVGVGEVVNRDRAFQGAREPLDLMAQAVREAFADAGLSDVANVDRLDVVQQFSWPIHDAPGQLATLLGAQPAWLRYGPVGGETPVAFIHEAALAILRGESSLAVVVGAEAQYSVNAAQAAGEVLPWRARDDETPLVRGAAYQPELAKALGVSIPATIYPLFENAAIAACGLTPAAAHQESAQLWSAFSEVAAQQPCAWSRQTYTPEEIATASSANRRVAWPYTKRMVANPAVNQAAAVVLTSRAQALAWGIAPERWVHVLTGASAQDPANVMARDDLATSPGRDAVLDTVRERLGRIDDDLLLELYSCFPVVPKLARRRLGLSAQRALTVTGGLSFFGAPLNNYMSHAVVAMVRRLRQSRADARGLLYGQGGNMTKHHALVLGRQPGRRADLEAPACAQARADAARAPAPEWSPAFEGPAQVETFTVIYARSGEVSHGVVVLRNAAHQRGLARVDPQDSATLARLMDVSESPVGSWGEVFVPTRATQPGAPGPISPAEHMDWPHWRYAPEFRPAECA